MLDKEFGEISISIRSNMKRITARWRNDRLVVNMPPFVPLNSIASFINENRDTLRALRNKALEKARCSVSYELEQRIPCFKGEVHITSIEYKPNFTGYKRDKDGNMFIFISSRDDISTSTKQNAISSAMKALMKRTAPHVLIPYAWETAREIGVSPKEIVIGRGAKKLGHCTSKGVIQLSFMLMFMPEELVRYIICHELAHLTVMNHSPQFHALCNTYCNGKEKALEQMLKGFRYPLLEN